MNPGRQNVKWGVKFGANQDPRVQKLLRLVPNTQVWSLMDREPLESWVHPEGKVCLLGDACHPMLVRSFVNLHIPSSLKRIMTRSRTEHREL